MQGCFEFLMTKYMLLPKLTWQESLNYKTKLALPTGKNDSALITEKQFLDNFVGNNIPW